MKTGAVVVHVDVGEEVGGGFRARGVVAGEAFHQAW